MPPIRSERKELSPCGGSINPVQHTVRKPKLFRNEKTQRRSQTATLCPLRRCVETRCGTQTLRNSEMLWVGKKAFHLCCSRILLLDPPDWQTGQEHFTKEEILTRIAMRRCDLFHLVDLCLLQHADVHGQHVLPYGLRQLIKAFLGALDDASIRTAVKLWVENPEKGLDLYGHISLWDTHREM